MVAVTGCGGEASLSSDQVRRDAKVVFRADLEPGSTGKTAARIVQRFRLDGVSGARGDSGSHVWVYSTGDVTSEQVAKIRERLESLPAVESVTRLR